MENPSGRIKKTFIKESDLIKHDDPKTVAEVKLSKQLDNCIFNVTISSIGDAPKGSAMKIYANFDHKFTDYPSEKIVEEITGRWSEKYKVYQETCEKILSMGID